MNKHFEDARYYLRKAGERTVIGAREALEPVETRLRELTGRELEPEPTPVESLLEDVREFEAREAIGDVRRRLEARRPRR